MLMVIKNKIQTKNNTKSCNLTCSKFSYVAQLYGAKALLGR